MPTLRPTTALRPGSRRRAVILFVVLLFLYLANLRELAPDDTVATRYLPFSIVTRHSLNVDPYKPSNALIAIPMIAWFCLREWRGSRATVDVTPAARIVSLFVPLAALGVFVFWYNFHYFGDLLGAYRYTFEDIGYSSVAAGFRGGWRGFLDGAGGLLVSPNRGLFVFVPWTVLSLWGAVRLWREAPLGWERWLLAGSVLVYLLYAKLERWYGGYNFGPRYLVELLPVFALCLVPVWRAATTGPRRALVAVLVLLALGVQCIGVFNYPGGMWNETPLSVDVVPQRVWDWRDLEIVRTWRAGPAPTHLLDHLHGRHETF